MIKFETRLEDPYIIFNPDRKLKKSLKNSGINIDILISMIIIN